VTETVDVIQQIKLLLVEDMQIGVRPEDIPEDYSLLESGLALDSILIAELITRIEDRFGIQFDDRELEPDLFNNLSRLAAFVESRRSAVRPDPALSQPKEAAC
jgi:acyl carrier protein